MTAPAGLVLEVEDLAATRAFYEAVFRHARGEWSEGRDRLAFRSGAGSVELVRRAAPRTLPQTGQHQAYRVPADRLPRLLEELVSRGHSVDWWREDHPAERSPTAYLHDPSGNRVQLVASESAGLLDHVAVEVHDLEHAESFYVETLGGGVDYYHGWRMEDYAEAKAWEAGTDPCAPWTRRFDVRYWDKLRVARPNMQLFFRFGSSLLGVVLATEHRQEPPEELLRGTPRLLLRAGGAPDVAAQLAARGVRFERDGGNLFLRDPGGNFVELLCDSLGFD